MLFGYEEREDTVDYYRAAEVAPTLMPSAQKLSFYVYVQEFIKDGHHEDDCVSLALEYYSSLQYVWVGMDCENASCAEVEQVEAALRRAADAHPNRPAITTSK
jgi:hypothetical protein